MKIIIETKNVKKAFTDTALAATAAVIVIGPFIYACTLDSGNLFLGLIVFWAAVAFFLYQIGYTFG